MDKRKCLIDKVTIKKKLQRIALEIAEQLSGEATPLVLLGIHKNGIVIAEKIAVLIKPYLSCSVEIATLRMNKQQPVNIDISTSIDFAGKNVVIVDDVSNSGKTLLYALKPLLNYHPNKIQVLVLVERMHKLYPIKPDYVGLSIATTLQDHIQVEVENGEINGAYLI